MSTSDRERERLRAVRAGDRTAWRAWFDETFPALDRYLLWRCGGLRDVADDLLQEVWLVAVRRLDQFDPAQGPFLAWLRGIGGAPGGPGMTGGAGKAPVKTRLEQLLEDTYRYNAEIRLAEAKLIEAQAMLAKVRMDVTQKVVQAEAAIRLAELEVEAATSNLKLADENSKSGIASGAVREKARQDMLKAKATFENARTNLDYVTGKAEKALPGGRLGGGQIGGSGGQIGGGGGIGGAIGGGAGMIGGPAKTPAKEKPGSSLSADTAQKMAKALRQKITFDFSDKGAKDLTIGLALKQISVEHKLKGVFSPGLAFEELMKLKVPPYEASEMTLGAMLLLLEDRGGIFYFVIEEYGICSCAIDHTREETLPEGVIRVRDFLRTLNER